MAYKVFARKYRPEQFSEVVAQRHVKKTLANAIALGRVSHAYLFSGPRGVGKTTIARIMVKALNCTNYQNEAPCRKCSSCVALREGKSLDYLELDGASNRGIDQIRELNENLKYSSPHGSYRVFVIDEVHMLTIEAFNALLKSLEEPPPKVVFILCTTESQKVPATIRSRCQHFRFHPFTITELQTYLAQLAVREGIRYDEKSLYYLSKRAGGSLRDAENLLEQTLSYSGSPLTREDTEIVLGQFSEEKIFLFLHNLTQQKLANNYALLTQLKEEGFETTPFFYEILSWFSSLVYLKAGVKEEALLGLDEAERKTLLRLEPVFSLQEIFTLQDLFFEALKEMKESLEPERLAAYFLIKFHRYQNLITPEELKANLLNLANYTLPDENILELHSNAPKAPAPAAKATRPPVASLKQVPKGEENGAVRREISYEEAFHTIWSLMLEKAAAKEFKGRFFFEAFDPASATLFLNVVGKPLLEAEKQRFLTLFKHSFEEKGGAALFSTPLSRVEFKENAQQKNIKTVLSVFPSAKLV